MSEQIQRTNQYRAKARGVNYNDYVWGWSARAATAVFLFSTAAAGLVLLVDKQINHYPYTTIFVLFAPLLLGLLLAGAAWGYCLATRRRQFDRWVDAWELAQADRVTTPIEERRPEEIVLVNGRQTLMKRRPDKTVAADGHKYKFSGRNLDRLLHWYEAGATSIRREHSTTGPGFDMLPDKIAGNDYTTALHILKKISFVDNANNWTEAGSQWLRQE